MTNIVIGIDCPGCGTVKDVKIPYKSNALSVTTDSNGKIVKVSLPQLKYIDTKRIVYIYFEEK